MVNGDEVSESAKAVQEVAKTTKAGIEATEKLGGFVSKIINEPIDAVVGILSDKLKFVRWERQIRLTERATEIIKSKNIEGELRTVPPKIALPIIENASLEENDELQDLWAYFIASSVDPNFDGTLRAAFIDIIKQLEVIDVHILNFIYDVYEKENEYHKARWSGSKPIINNLDTGKCPISERTILDRISINVDNYKESIDNLIRVGCVSPFISEQKANIPIESKINPFISDRYSNRYSSNPPSPARAKSTQRINFNVTHKYDEVCITPLGLSFTKACMPQNKEVEEESENRQTAESKK